MLELAQKHGMKWPMDDDVTNIELIKIFYPERQITVSDKAEPNCAHIHKELARSGVTLTLLWNEYCENCYNEKKSGRGFHSIRRAYATEMSMAGVTLPIISQILGHKCINNDKPYLTYYKEQNALCSIDFSGIPTKNGVYSSDCSVFNATDKGGCSK